jgi:hypothetical protein
MTDPHRPLFLDDDKRMPTPEMRRMSEAGFTLINTKRGMIYRRDQRLILPASMARELLARLMRETGGRCFYCKERVHLVTADRNSRKGLEATVEHRQAISRGGTWKRFNLTCACATCNQMKGTLPEKAFQEIIAETPPVPGGSHIARRRVLATAAQNASNKMFQAFGQPKAPAPPLPDSLRKKGPRHKSRAEHERRRALNKAKAQRYKPVAIDREISCVA